MFTWYKTLFWSNYWKVTEPFDKTPRPTVKKQLTQLLFFQKRSEKLLQYGVKHRPNKLGSPHLNGKVERSQKTDKTELYSTIDIYSENIDSC